MAYWPSGRERELYDHAKELLRRQLEYRLLMIELIAARRRMVNEGLTNVGKGLERELAKDVLVLEEARRCTGREGDGRRRMVSW